MNTFISELELIPLNPSPNSENLNEILTFIKNYTNSNPTFKDELVSYGLYIVDSIFNQEEYELAVETGK